MECIRCKNVIEDGDGHINCSVCGDFCGPACFNLYHDANPHKKPIKKK